MRRRHHRQHSRVTRRDGQHFSVRPSHTYRTKSYAHTDDLPSGQGRGRPLHAPARATTGTSAAWRQIDTRDQRSAPSLTLPKNHTCDSPARILAGGSHRATTGALDDEGRDCSRPSSARPTQRSRARRDSRALRRPTAPGARVAHFCSGHSSDVDSGVMSATLLHRPFSCSSCRRRFHSWAPCRRVLRQLDGRPATPCFFATGTLGIPSRRI